MFNIYIHTLCNQHIRIVYSLLENRASTLNVVFIYRVDIIASKWHLQVFNPFNHGPCLCYHFKIKYILLKGSIVLKKMNLVASAIGSGPSYISPQANPWSPFQSLNEVGFRPYYWTLERAPQLFSGPQIWEEQRL